MTLSPIDTNGCLRVQAEKLCDVLGVLPDELWSAEQVRPLERNWTELEMSSQEVVALIGSSDEDVTAIAYEKKEMGKVIDSALKTITQREEKIVRARFYEELTLEEVADRFGVTRERVRQIESRALRKLRHPKRSCELKQYSAARA
jgi:DNA-directed RNA polymerase sigma subunit (sigma70/sigma32)